ncbi:MAG: alcohol dehydrogenase catalytic domain-containing protein [Deltaproteobacteria bacterium]|nr:alcohol dehydrogenase catalytic domain-containing protein [Deltaproteobacteria bacterium]
MSLKCRAAILVEPNQPLVVDEVELPDPAPDQVLVKLFASGVCHSQLHTMSRPPRPGRRLPALLGHESTGVVAAKGRNVRHVKEGDHVMTTWVDRDNSTTPLRSSTTRSTTARNMWRSGTGRRYPTQPPLGRSTPSPPSASCCRCPRTWPRT